MLILARKLHESIIIGDRIVVSIVDIKGDQVKIGIDAPSTVKVYRKEVYEAIQKENRIAARSQPDKIKPFDGLIDRPAREEAGTAGGDSPGE